MTLNKRESRSSSLNTKNTESKGNSNANTSSHKMAYLALHDAYNDQHRNPNSSGHQYFNDIDDLDDYHDGVLPHEHADAIFDPPPIGRDTGGDVAPPWLGLHLEQQTVMMAQWTTERRAMAEENDRLRRLLAEAEERIRELELIAPLSETGKDKMASPGNVEGSGNSCGGGSSTNPAEVEGRSRSHKRSESGADCGSVCSVATTVIAGTANSKSVFTSPTRNRRGALGKSRSGSGATPSAASSAYFREKSSPNREKSIGARRTTARCKEGLGGGGVNKQKKKFFFSRNSRSSNLVARKSTRVQRSRSHSPRRNDRKENYGMEKVSGTRVGEDYNDDTATSPSSCADDDDISGIFDYARSSAVVLSLDRRLSPLTPSSKNSTRRQLMGSLPINNGKELKEASTLPRSTMKVIHKKSTPMAHSNSTRRIVFSKATGINSKSTSIVSESLHETEAALKITTNDVSMIEFMSARNNRNDNENIPTEI